MLEENLNGESKVNKVSSLSHTTDHSGHAQCGHIPLLALDKFFVVQLGCCAVFLYLTKQAQGTCLMDQFRTSFDFIL